MAKKRNDNNLTENIKPESPCVEQYITDTLENSIIEFNINDFIVLN